MKETIFRVTHSSAWTTTNALEEDLAILSHNSVMFFKADTPIYKLQAPQSLDPSPSRGHNLFLSKPIDDHSGLQT